MTQNHTTPWRASIWIFRPCPDTCRHASKSMHAFLINLANRQTLRAFAFKSSVVGGNKAQSISLVQYLPRSSYVPTCEVSVFTDSRDGTESKISNESGWREPLHGQCIFLMLVLAMVHLYIKFEVSSCRTVQRSRCLCLVIIVHLWQFVEHTMSRMLNQRRWR